LRASNGARKVSSIGGLPNRWDTDGGDSVGAVAGRFPATLLFRGRAVLSAALSRAPILKPQALATVHALAVMVARLAIGLAFAGVHSVAVGDLLGTRIRRIGGSRHSDIRKREQGCGGSESQV
jgi:hypothetical protein